MASVRKRFPNDPASPWVVAYTDQGGKRRLKTFKKKKDADRYRTQVEAEIERGDHVAANDSATVASVCDEFIKHCDQRVRDGLIGHNRRMQVDQTVRHHIEPFLGKKVFSELTIRDIESWYVWLSKKPRCSLTSRRIYIEVLKRIEEFAIRRGMAKRKPIAEFKIERGATARAKIATFSVEQIGALLRAAEIRPPGFRHRFHELLRLAVHLAAFCGLRRGEIFALSMPNVDYERRVLKIRHGLTPYGELKGPKTPSGVRDVPIPAHLLAMLEVWRDTHYRDGEGQLLFTSENGEPFHLTSSLHLAWRKLLKRAGLYEGGSTSFHFHALRHFAASWMMESGISPPDVAALLGHRTFDMTLQVYAHPVLSGSHRHGAVDRMASGLLVATRQPTVDATYTRHSGLTT